MGSVDWFRAFDEVGRAFRQGKEAQGSAALVNCVDLLLPRLSELPSSVAEQVQELLGLALTAQERKDFLGVADLLEFEIAPLLQQTLG